MIKEIWFAIGINNDTDIWADVMHIKFFNSSLEAYDQMDTYICLYGSAYMGTVPEEKL